MRRTAVLPRLSITVATISLIGAAFGVAPPPAGAADTTRFERAAQAEGAGRAIHGRSGSRGQVSALEVSRRPATLRPAPMVLDLPSSIPGAAEDPGNAAPSLSTLGPVPTTPTLNPPVALPGVAGINSDGAYSGVEPPDSWVAAGPDHIVQVTNVAMRILDRNGTTIIPDFALADFFGLPYDFYNSEPRVHFDSLHQRWLMTELSWVCDIGDGTPVGFIDLAVSETADPLGDWALWWYGYDYLLPDSPALGSSTQTLGFGANFFEMTPGCGFEGTGSAGYVIFDWADLLADGALGIPEWLDAFESFAPLDFYATPRVAFQSPATSPALHTIVQSAGAETWNPTYLTWTGSVVAGTIDIGIEVDLAEAGVAAPWVEPPEPQQPGPDSVTSVIDSRPTDAIWQGNRLAFVSTHGCTPSGDSTIRDCVRVTEVTTNTAGTSTPAAAQDFLIAENGRDNYHGGIGLSGDGTLFTVWTRSSAAAGDYPSSVAAYQLGSDPPNSLSATEVLAAGTGTYIGDRWGYYVGVAQDPQVPNAVWQGNQYSAGASGWGTRVSQLQTGGSSYVPITPLRVVDSRIGLGVSSIFGANVPRTFDVAGFGTIPTNAIAVTGNVTVVNQSAAGFVAITPTATATPPSSTINFPLGDIRANNFTTSLDAAGNLAAVYKAVAGKRAHIIVDITGYFLAGSGDATYTTTEPVRVMDTRPSSHIGTATTFVAGTPQTLQVAGIPGIPPTATAITGNLTVVNQSKAGYLSVTPDPPVWIPSSSTLNFPLVDIRANGLTADLNATGALSVTYSAVAGATTNVLLDITGYYVEDDAAGLLFYPLNPGRVLDSRPGAVLTGLIGAFVSNTAETLDVDGHWGVPAGAEAITGNLTVVNQTAAGFIAATPVATNDPSTSTLNFPLGDIRANGITVPLGAGNTGLVYKAVAGRTTHLILDLTGYFK